jgi:hypothetical protein
MRVISSAVIPCMPSRSFELNAIINLGSQGHRVQGSGLNFP